MEILIQLLMATGAVFLIILILLQRGRGGGLAGALGGMGGQSAFGAKAGDVFTKITAWAATVWFLVCLAGGLYMGTGQGGPSATLGKGAPVRVEKEDTNAKPGPVKGGAGPTTPGPAKGATPGNKTTTP